jgi:CheY-like chemotaxis protein
MSAAITDNRKASGTWLVVDDDPSILSLASQMLQRMGLTVLTANDGVEAVALLPAHPELSGILLDLAMPRLDGAATFDILRQMRPEVPVVLVTGCADERLDRMKANGLSGYLPKPFALADLRRIVNEVSVS